MLLKSLRLLTSLSLLYVISACTGGPTTIGGIQSQCETAADCIVYTACCDVYNACNKNDLETCIKQETYICENEVDCVGTCPNAPSEEDYKSDVLCIDNVCTINPKNINQAFGCHY